MIEAFPILETLPFEIQEREGREVGVVTRDCRVVNDHGRLEVWRAGEYFGHATFTEDAYAEDEAILNGDVRAAARVALVVERNPIVLAADALVREELKRDTDLARSIRNANPDGRPRRADYRKTYRAVCRLLEKGAPLKDALFRANRILSFCSSSEPEALDKAWRRVLSKGFANPLAK